MTNLRVMCHDAIEVLDKMIPDNSPHMVQLFFPDPRHKACHNKRRIVQLPFAGKSADKTDAERYLPYGDRLAAVCGAHA